MYWRHLFKPHPWHGVSIGARVPEAVTCYIEIVPVDTVKYEVDKASGYLRIDRPQRYSNVCPTPYGFVPRPYCGPRVAERSSQCAGRPGAAGDGAFGAWQDVSDCPKPLIERLRHYFLTYKADPDSPKHHERFIAEVYGREEAHETIRRAQQDYCERFPEIVSQFDEWQRGRGSGAG